MEVRIPDIGDYKDVPIIEVHVQPGATIKVDDPLITLESDKATMEVPAPQSGTISEVKVKVGDRVSQGDVIAVIEGGTGVPLRPSATTRPARAKRATDRRRSRPGRAERRGQGARAGRKAACRRSRATSTPRCWCSAPGPAATPPPSGPPISARRSCWWTAGRASGAYA